MRIIKMEQKYNEILQLKIYCDKIGVKCALENFYDGFALQFSSNGDFVQHSGSFGGNTGCVEPAIGCEVDYKAVSLDNAKKLVRKYKNKLNKENND